MINIKQQIAQAVQKAVKELYGIEEAPAVPVQRTRKDFEGDYTVVVFPFTKAARKKPEQIGDEIGLQLVAEIDAIESHNVVKGFLNLKLSNNYWFERVKGRHLGQEAPYEKTDSPDKIMVEYSSPNTNKPLHLGHIRNNLLGYSISEILKARGHQVTKVNLVNDRGIHICKSMLAWQLYGKGETPASSGLKGDHLVGKYYVAFDKEYKVEIAGLVKDGMDADIAKKEAPLMKAAQEMLIKWEAGDTETVELWRTMNGWVYEGFDVTYKKLGVDFDKFYYESDTYLLGKDLIQEGLKTGIFFTKDDGSIWVDLTEEGLDEKLVLRSDGTAVYMTQDIGTADLKYEEYGIDRSLYTVGDEQEYHFKVLKLIMQKLGKSYADGIYHVSYGMIDLPTGRMKSREGTVVDADDLIEEMRTVAKKQTESLGKTEGLDQEGLEKLYSNLGLGALKYYLLKVDPKRRMVFNPEESIDFQGNTGPFIQYNHTRICSLERKLGTAYTDIKLEATPQAMANIERELCYLLQSYGDALREAEDNYSPAIVANYCYELARGYSSFFAECHVVREEDADKRNFRAVLSNQVGETLRAACALLGMELPSRM